MLTHAVGTLFSWLVKNYLVHDKLMACPSSLGGICVELGLTLLGIVPGGTFLFAKRYKAAKDQMYLRLRSEADDTAIEAKKRGVELDKLKSAWKIEWSELTIFELIGSGTYGDVSRALWSGTEVAVKQMVKRRGNRIISTDSEAFEAEAETMVALRHPNVVTFFGAGAAESGDPFIVTELMSSGTLRNLLKKHGSNPLSWEQRRGVCIDVASGMHFLHSRSPPIVHRDLKSDNCLVSANLVVKIADFGTVTRLRGHESWDAAVPQSDATAAGAAAMAMTATLGAGSPLWTAPEVWQGKHGIAHYGTAVDVFSFGMVMYELTTAKLPFHNKHFDHVMDIADFVIAGGRPDDVPNTTPSWYMQIMEQCWNADATERPTFEVLATRALPRAPIN